MLRYIYGRDLHHFPRLRDTMHRDRASQFRDRMKWDVTVDGDGYERDAYDAMNPLYVIWQQPDGSHGGSMRFLPTSGCGRFAPGTARRCCAALGCRAICQSIGLPALSGFR